MDKFVVPEKVLLNRGCGIMFLQRGHNKIRFDQIPENIWFLKEKICDKISFTLPWSVLEPKEKNYQWKHPDWEGAIDSWIKAGFKVALQIRAQDTWGTFYNDGVPQWVFDAGAKYIDEPLEWYKGGYGALNFIPDNQAKPIRFPVYWDEIYLEKVEQLVNAMGKRYNGRPEIEYITLGHIGRWGEMHITGHSPLQPWFDAGYSLDTFVKTHKRIVDIYRKAFPDTQLVQEICAPCYAEEDGEDLHPLQSVPELYEYFTQNQVHLKYNGIGYNWHEGDSLYLDQNVSDIFNRHYKDTKVSMENLVLPQALEKSLKQHISYWHRGGETTGLGILNIDKGISINEKKVYSYYNFWGDDYDQMTIEDEKNIWRNMASGCGYRLTITEFEYNQVASDKNLLQAKIKLKNSGSAPCYEKLEIVLALCDGQNIVWESSEKINSGHEAWNLGKHKEIIINWDFPSNIKTGKYSLQAGLRLLKYGQEFVELANTRKTIHNLYEIDTMELM